MKKTILIVDDQMATRMLLRHFLGNFYHVVTKQDAMDALLWLKEGNKPDLIVMDMIMPRMSGMEFMSQAESEVGTLPPMIILSSVENSMEKIKSFSLGASDYVTKPFNPQELRVRIQKILSQQQAIAS